MTQIFKYEERKREEKKRERVQCYKKEKEEANRKKENNKWRSACYVSLNSHYPCASQQQRETRELVDRILQSDWLPPFSSEVSITKLSCLGLPRGFRVFHERVIGELFSQWEKKKKKSSRGTLDLQEHTCGVWTNCGEMRLLPSGAERKSEEDGKENQRV